MIDFVYYSKSTTTATTGSPAIAEKSNSKKENGRYAGNSRDAYYSR
jgi:hypothetical protein